MATSLALIEGDHTVLGIVDAPFLELRYHAIAGEGAYQTGKGIQVTATSRLADAVVALGDYAVGPGAEL